jgi:hypothetical protein
VIRSGLSGQVCVRPRRQIDIVAAIIDNYVATLLGSREDLAAWPEPAAREGFLSRALIERSAHARSGGLAPRPSAVLTATGVGYAGCSR